MTYTKIPIFLFLLFASIYNLYSQNIQVLNETTGEPVSNVALFNKNKSLATLSDEAGKANISIFGEKDSVFFQHPSYNKVAYSKSELTQMQNVFLSKRIILIDEFVISATKSRENKKNVAFQVDVLENRQLLQSTATSSADLLLSTGNLVVQKSQGGGGSPILRGFEANKILLVVDGVRMNNAIYRSGHLQNSITIDNAVLDRAEIIYGPTSLIYGSDALGGVIHYYTKDPVLADEKAKPVFSINAKSRYSTANSGKYGHLSFSNGFKHFAYLTSVSYKNLGNIRMGANRNPFYGDFGKLMHYAGRINGEDTTLTNPDPLVQKNTGYNQLDLLQKIRYVPSKYYEWILNLQYSNSSPIDRLDKLNDYSGSELRYAEYYYGPQNRLLASLKSIVKKDNQLFTNLTTTLAFQKIDEDRISRRFRIDDKFHQKEDVDILSLTMDFLKIVNNNRLNYGLEANYNKVASQAFYRNIISGETREGTTRYPDGGSEAGNFALYSNYKWSPTEKLLISAGARYSISRYSSSFQSTLLPYNRIEIGKGALTGSMNIIYKPGEKWKITGILSTGFRNPNVDDYGKVRAKDNQVTVPNPDLSPEYTYNAELGITKTIEGYIKITASAFYTLLNNAIVRADFRLNNSDSLEYDGEMYKIITNANANRAYIRGLSLNVVSDLNSNLGFKSTLNYFDGKNITEDVPLGHIPPVFGRTSVHYQLKKSFTGIFIDYNGWKRIEDMSPFEEDNDAEATEYGFPGWYTVNLKAGYNIYPSVELQLAVENIFDSFYKPFASGVSAPGRNFIFTLRAVI